MTTPPPQPPEPVPPQGGSPASDDDKTMAQICHFGMVIFGFWPALIIYLVKSDAPWVKNEAAKAFNFSIITSVILVFFSVLRFIDFLFISCFACVLMLAVIAIQAVYGIINGLKVNEGKETAYPVEIPLLK